MRTAGFWLAGAFVCGSIPSAYLMTRALTGKDIRLLGSGNVGATNVFRNVGAAGGLAVLGFDALKGILPLFAFEHWGWEQGFSVAGWNRANCLLALGIAAVLGHVFSPFLRFKGGKGVATSAGVAAYLFLPYFAVSAAVFGLILWRSKIMSLASLVGIYLFMFQLVIFSRSSHFAIAVVGILSLFLTWTHRSNLSRLANKQEHKFFIKNRQK